MKNKFNIKAKALQVAKDTSKDDKTYMCVILSNGRYYVETTSLVRLNEKLIAEFENGKQLKSK